jgi:hypothetical protein
VSLRAAIHRGVAISPLEAAGEIAWAFRRQLESLAMTVEAYPHRHRPKRHKNLYQNSADAL